MKNPNNLERLAFVSQLKPKAKIFVDMGLLEIKTTLTFVTLTYNPNARLMSLKISNVASTY